MIREQGYRAVARPLGKSDEMVIAAKADSGIAALDDLKQAALLPWQTTVMSN